MTRQHLAARHQRATRPTLNALLRAFFVGIICLGTVRAETHGSDTRALQEISTQIAKEQYSRALDNSEKLVAANPDNARARFFKGVALSRLDRRDEALALFSKLTEEFPELPEPYNNLAVLYAERHDYDNAQRYLEMALRANRRYAVAHENLGDLYLRRATQSYESAIANDPGASTPKRKLTAVKDLLVPPKGSRQP